MSDIGFYNKYIFMSNSYEVNHLVRKIVKNNKNKCNNVLNSMIDKQIKNLVKPMVIVKPSSIKKKINKIVTFSDIIQNNCNKYTNTEIINKINQSTNTEIVSKNINTINFERNFFYGTSESSLSSRINSR